MTRDPRHRIVLHHSNHLIDVMDTWPATRRRRFPFGLRRDPLKGWMVSDEAVGRGLWQRMLEPLIRDTFAAGVSFIEGPDMEKEFDAEFIKGIADWKATQYAEYRIKRGYVSPLSIAERRAKISEMMEGWEQ